MKKRVFALLLTGAMVLGLAACGGGGAASSSAAPAAESVAETEAAGGESAAESAAEAEAPAAQSGEKELKVQVGPNPETIDPALNSAVDGANMILHAFEGLLIIDKDGAIQPGQAETWEQSEDGLTWTFHLRDGLKWSDGSDLTANDFVFAWKRICDPETAAPYAETVLSMVKGYDDAIGGNTDALAVTAPDDKTFVVVVKSAEQKRKEE